MRFRVLFFLLTVVLVSGTVPAEQEPTYEQAVARWPDMKRPITFLGLKDHPDEFAVMWNGNLSLTSRMLVDSDRKLFSARQEKSLQVSFSMGERPDFQNRYVEDGSTEPSLAGGHLPVAQIRQRVGDWVVLQEVFAAGQGGEGTGEWDSPVFLWIRFQVEDAGASDAPLKLWVQLAKNHTHYAMRSRSNVRISRTAPLYPRSLQAQSGMIVDSDGRAILASADPFQFHQRVPGSLESVALSEAQMDRNLCEFSLPSQRGASLDLVVPFLPIDPDSLKKVANQGYEKMRESIVRFWEGEISRGMQVGVPEEEINRLWNFHVPISFITADAHPNGDLIMDVSPHHYEAYWPTPNAMHFRTLVQQGFFEEVKAYLEPFRDRDRQRPVPNTGSSFATTEGYISGPTEHVYISWVSDHGAILWAASEYYLLSRDEDFLQRWMPVMLEGLEWIAHERAATKRRGGLGAGLMPAGRATDDGAQSFFVWSDGWVYRGLEAVCRVLDAIDHPQADRWERERQDYQEVFQKRFNDLLKKTSRWIDPSGKAVPFVPYDLRQTGPSEGKIDLFYVDTGPLFLGVSGLLPAGGEVMTWTLKWFTEGPYADSYDPQWSDWWDPASLPYEMSSGEPCYSWNIPLRFLRGEREKFLEGFYSLSAGSVSRRFLGSVEHRDGIQGMPAGNAVINTHLRNMLVFENPDGRTLELLRNAPGSWLEEEKEVVVEEAPTYFGPISYRVKTSAEEVAITVDPPLRQTPDLLRIYLHEPQERPIRELRVNGQAASPASSNSVEIENPSEKIEITVAF